MDCSRLAFRWVPMFVLLGGCATTHPAELFELSEESPRHRAMQTRVFETANKKELLSAAAAVLQDVGFEVEESVTDVGFLRAAKERSAREYGQEIGRVIMLFVTFLYVGLPTDLQQKIAATVITRPLDPEGSRHEVRIMFYRIVWKGAGHVYDQTIPPGKQRMEMIRDPLLYQQFFVKLSKSVFLEAHTI